MGKKTRPVYITNTYWTESSSGPMKIRLFIDHIIICFDYTATKTKQNPTKEDIIRLKVKVKVMVKNVSPFQGPYFYNRNF